MRSTASVACRCSKYFRSLSLRGAFRRVGIHFRWDGPCADTKPSVEKHESEDILNVAWGGLPRASPLKSREIAVDEKQT